MVTPYFYLMRKGRAPVVHQPFEEVYEVWLPPGSSPLTVARIRLVGLAKHRVYSLILRRAAAVAVEGRFQVDILKRIFAVPEERCFELPVGVDLGSAESACEHERSETRRLWEIPEDAEVLISVNRLDSIKRVDDLVEAAALMVGEHPALALLLVGTGPRESDLRNAVRTGGLERHVRFLGGVPERELYRLMAASDLYISATLHSGSVQGVIEAMACGLPVVTTGQDFWVHDDRNGYVVPKREPSALAEAASRILTDPARRARFAAESRRIARAYDFAALAGRAMAVYQRVLANTAPNLATALSSRRDNRVERD
jgi:glycosyltransferase involved in cell wall biosynthesis